jgi:hypothetical protein
MARRDVGTWEDLAGGQQTTQIEKLRATLAQMRSDEPSRFGQTGCNSVRPRKIIFSEKRRYNEEQLPFGHIFLCYSCIGYEFQRSKVVNLPSLQTIHRHSGPPLKEHEDKLAKLEDVPAYLHSLVKQQLLLGSGLYLAIDAISCSNIFLNPHEVKESNHPYLVLLNRQALHLDAKYQPLFGVSSKAGDRTDIQGTADEIVTKVKTQIRIPASSFDGDPSCTFRHDDFLYYGQPLSRKRVKSRQATQNNVWSAHDGFNK